MKKMYKFYMAPLAGITDRAFREIVKEYGADFTFTEMVNVKGLYYKDEKTLDLIDIGEDEENIGIQIFGRDLEIIKRVTYDYLNKLPVEVIDFNFGCPAPKIFKNGEGSALLREVELMGDIIRAIKENTDKSVSAKIRIGIDDESLNYMEVLESLEAAKPDFITVHGRTRKGYYEEPVNYGAIREMVEKSSIPIVANGGIFDLESLKRQEETGAKSFMIARGALGNPIIFKSLKEGKDLELSADERIDLIFKHYKKMIEYKDERLALFEMRKHTAWYLKGLRGSNKVKNEINNETSIDRVFKLLEEFRKSQEN